MPDYTRRSVLAGGLIAALNPSHAGARVMAEQLERESAGKPKDARITGAEMIRVEVPWESRTPGGRLFNQWAVAKISTDAGITGYAFGRDRIYNVKPWPSGDAVPESYIKRLGLGERYTPDELADIRKILMGKNPFAVEQFLLEGLGQYASFEHALWDVIGKLAGASVHHILGGAHEKIPAYLTFVWPFEEDAARFTYERQAEDILAYKQAGYRAVKMRCARKNAMEDVEALKVMKAAVGDGFEIRFDKTAQYTRYPWDYETALATAKELEKHGAGWVEEPLHTDDMDAHARLCRELEMPITGGEHYGGLAPFAWALAKNAYDIIQPDGFLAGGILNIRKIGAIAQGFGRECMLHGANSLTLAGWIQISASMPNCHWQEVAIVNPGEMPQEMWEPGLKLLNTPEMYRIENGEIHVPQGPGLGLDVNEAAMKEYKIPSEF